MKTVSILYACLLMTFVIAGPAFAQTPLGQGTTVAGPVPPGGFWSGISDLSSCNLGNFTLDTNVRIGYQVTGMSWDMPNENPSYVAHLNLSLDSGACVGRVGLDLRSCSGFDLFLNVTGSTLDTATVYNNGVDQWRNLGVRGSRVWKGKKVQYWEADGGVGATVLPGVAALAGVKVDQFNASLEIADWNQGNVFLLDEAHGGDIKTSVVAPYLGVGLSYCSSKVTLTCSPWLATVDARVPIHFFLEFGAPIAGTVQSGSYFKLQGAGGLVLDLDFQSAITLASGLRLDVWGNLNYLDWRNRGRASVDFLIAGGVPAIPPFNVLTQGASSVSENSHIRRGSYSLGIGTSLLF